MTPARRAWTAPVRRAASGRAAVGSMSVGGDGGLDPDHSGHRRPALHRRRGAADQPAPADGHKHHVELVDLLQQLQRRGSLTGHDVQVVEGVDQVQAPLGRQAKHHRFARGRRDALGDHLGAVGAGGRDFGGIGVGRHHDHRAGAGLRRGERDRLAVVARAHRDHAAGARRRLQRQQRVEGPARLERANPLQVLGLGEHLAAELGIQPSRAEHRGPVHPAGDARGGGLDVGEPEAGGVALGSPAAHPAAATIARAAWSAAPALTS